MHRSLTRPSRSASAALFASAVFTAALLLTGCAESGDQGSTTPSSAQTPSTTAPADASSSAAEPKSDAPQLASDGGAGKPAEPRRRPQVAANPAASTDEPVLARGKDDLPGSRPGSDAGSDATAPDRTAPKDDGGKPSGATLGAGSPSGATITPGSSSVKSDLGENPKTPSRDGAGEPGEGMLSGLIVAEPLQLDLGEIPTNDTKAGTVVLHNNGDTPIRLRRCRSSCGCTAAECPTGQMIDPGQTASIEIRMRGGSRPITLNKKVTFEFEGHENLIVPVKAVSVSYVETVPETMRPETMPDGELIVRSLDDQPFTISRMHPPIITEFPTEGDTQFALNIDWARWEELGSSRRLTFYVDHPKGTQVVANVRPQRKTPTRPGADSPATPATTRTLETQVARGQVDEVIASIEDGTYEVDHVTRNGATILGLAAKEGLIGLMEYLIEGGANLESTDELGRTPLIWAAQSKNPEAVRVLLDAGSNIRAADQAVGSALSWAAGFGDAESVEILLEAGSDVNIAGRMTGFTPLMWACNVGEADKVQALIDAGAELEARDITPEGQTPLMHAAITGRTDNVRALLAAGADIEARSASKKTVLLVAAQASGSTVETVQALVDAGADVTVVDERDQNALDLARNRTDPRAKFVIEYLEGVMGAGDGAGE